MRTFAIWLFGVLASAIVGGMAGSALLPSVYDFGAFWGVLAGICTFVCARLWLANKPA